LSGQFVIQFTTIVNNSLVNGIEITSTSAPAPSVANLSPASGPEGTLVTITGANFGTAQGTVKFSGAAAPVASWSPSTIMVAVPSGAISGDVVVTAGALASNGVSFTVLPLQLPSQAQVLAAIENVNNYWMANNAAGNSDWNRATYFTGDLAAYDATGQANYLSFAQSWASQNNYSLIGGNTTTWPDYQAAGQVYIRLYQLSNTSSDLSGITESINGMVNSTVDNEWTWIDAINMSMPDFAELGSIENNTNYYTKMYALYSYAKYTAGLYDSTTGLWWENGKDVNTSNHWSRGNGWVFAAHAKVLSVLPKSDPHYAEYLSTFTTMAQALAARQQPGGYWNSDLTGTDNAGPESSGTSFFLYGLAWGLNNGILDQNTYLPVVEKAWNFLANTAIQPSGLLGYVQPSGPGPTLATSTYDYGVGAFLLAARQMALLTQ
jgi:rhamnogalacturonyl hydrolase YesR